MGSMPPETTMTSSIGRDNGPVGRGPPGARDPPYAPYRPNGNSAHPRRSGPGGGKLQLNQQQQRKPGGMAGMVPSQSRAAAVHAGASGSGGSNGAKPHHPRGVQQNPGAFSMPPGGDIVESPGESAADLATESTPMLGPPAMPVAEGTLPPPAPLPGATPVPKLGPPAMPRPPSYRETPEPGTVSVGSSGFHTPSEAGSPAGSAAVSPAHTPGDQPVMTVAGLRPVSQPPSYEDVLREDHRGGPRGGGGGGARPPKPGATGATLGCLGDDDHFDSRYSDSD